MPIRSVTHLSDSQTNSVDSIDAALLTYLTYRELKTDLHPVYTNELLLSFKYDKNNNYCH